MPCYRLPQHQAITAPRPVFWHVAHTCPHRVENDIPRQLQQIRLALHNNSFKPALKNMTHPVMTAVVPLGVNAVKLPHTCAEVCVNGFYNDMKVVVHQAISMAKPVEPGADFTQQINPTLAISIAKINVFAPVAARCHVIQPAGKLDS